MEKIYCDYAATTPVDKRVFESMEPYFSDKFGNPGSLHSFGQEAIKALDESREKIADALGVDFREIIFTGSATEANNLALRGVAKQYQRKSAEISINQRPKILISAIEHESVLETAYDLEKEGVPALRSLPALQSLGDGGGEGVEVVEIPVDKNGVVDLDFLKSALDENVVLVSVMSANNEIGTIQPISKIAKIIQDFRKEKSNHKPLAIGHLPLFHSDAVQAFQYLPCKPDNLGAGPRGERSEFYGVDLMTISAHKIYGPKGVGALYIRNNKSQTPNNKQTPNNNNQNDKNWNLDIGAWNFPAVAPLVTGGNQEFGLRSGTENLPMIVGFAKAVEITEGMRGEERERMTEVGKYFWKKLKETAPDVQLNGPSIVHRPSPAVNRGSADAGSLVPRSIVRLPNIFNIYFPNQKAEELMIKLDMAGVAVSTGAACSARSVKSSHVLTALGHNEQRANSSLRFSFGRDTDKEQIDELINRIEDVLE